MIKKDDDSTINGRAHEGIVSPRRTNRLLSGTKVTLPTPILKTESGGTQLKRVNFSDDRSIISCARAPASVRVASSDLIREYLEDCERTHVKPVEQLISQLSHHEIISQRLPSINLKGVRLDFKTVESLEVVFLNVQAEYLNFEDTMLDEESCVSLCEIILYYSSCFALSFGNNTRIGNRGWTSLSQVVAQNSNLEQLDLSRMVFTETSAISLGKGLRLSSSLRVIRLDNCYLNGERLRILMDSLVQGCTVEEVYLAENRISSSDCVYIADLLRHNRSLKVLDLESNPIQDTGLKHLCTALVDSEVRRLETLQLWNTGITCTGMQFISFYLMKEKFSHESIALRSLNIGKNRIGDEGLMALKPVLARNKSLERLGLASTRLSAVGVVTLAEIIAENKHLVRIDMRDNGVNAAGLIALSQALRHNTTMLKINFNASFKVDVGMEVELNNVLDEIKTRCTENLEARLANRVDDITSTLSTFSNESVGRLTPQPSQPSFTTTFFNFLSAPFRLTRNKLFGVHKIDIELDAAPLPGPSSFPRHEETDPSTSLLPPITISLPDLKVPFQQENDHIPPQSPTYNVSRFQITQVARPTHTHRRCLSENLLAKPNNSQLNTFIRLSKPSQPLPALNVIPSSELDSPFSMSESSTPKLKRTLKLRRQRSRSADYTKKNYSKFFSYLQKRHVN